MKQSLGTIRDVLGELFAGGDLYELRASGVVRMSAECN